MFLFKKNRFYNQSINQSIYLMSWGATGTQQTKSFSSVNLYSQNLLPTCKAFPKETTTCIWSSDSYLRKDMKSATVLQEVQML